MSRSGVKRVMAGWLAGWLGWLAGWLATDCLFKNSGAATKSLLKAAWCLLRIATPCAVLRRLTEVAGRPAARCLHATNLPPSHSFATSVFFFEFFLTTIFFDLTQTSTTFSTSIGLRLRLRLSSLRLSSPGATLPLFTASTMRLTSRACAADRLFTQS